MNPIVEVETGPLQGARQVAGKTRREVRCFHRVPYAAAPVGPLRFRAPRPASRWTDVRDATGAGPAPMQSLGGPYSGFLPGSTPLTVSEDCLTLDIWTPAGALAQPVLVWIPGGAFVNGGASLPTYDGSALAADHDLVVVGVNYRLGALGFAWLKSLRADDSDTNCGLRDQIAALEWVRRNIEVFGGNPANVTAVGESAGAGSLLHLLASTARLPVRRCILQSPGVDHSLRIDQAEHVTATLLRHLPARSDTETLRSLPAETIIEAQDRAVAEVMPAVSAMPIHPVVGDDLLPSTPSVALAAGAASDIEILVSWTADEMRLYRNSAADEGGIPRVTEWTAELIGRRLGTGRSDRARAAELVALYREMLERSGRTSPADLWSAILTDGVMRLPCRRAADLHAASGGTTYVMEFAWHGSPPNTDWDPGAFHAIDLPFTFGTLDGCGWREFLRAGDDADRLVLAHMDAWAGFARDGQPASGSLPTWPRYRTDERTTLIFKTSCEVAEDPLALVAEAWKDLWSPECRAPGL